jgi:hypothetical protein
VAGQPDHKIEGTGPSSIHTRWTSESGESAGAVMPLDFCR